MAYGDCGCGCNSCGGLAKTNPAGEVMAGGGFAVMLILGSIGFLYALEHIRMTR